MEKNDIYKILALLVVAAFVIEGVAIGVLSGSGKQTSGGTGQQQGETLTGVAEAEMTIVRYEPYLIVTGDSAAIDAVKQKLTEEGLATYSVSSQDSVIVSLKSGKAAPAAFLEFEKANLSATASAVVSTPDTIKVETDGATVSVEGTSFNMKMRPLYEEGAKVPSRFSANVQDGQLVSISNFMFLPSAITGAQVSAQLLNTSRTDYAVEVAWENRTAAKQPALSEGAAYRQKSFIIIPQNASQAQLDALKIYDYITAAQPGILSVKNDFIDIETAKSHLSLMRLEASFPPSLATFSNDTGNKSAALAEKLNAEGINATLTSRQTARAALPEFIEQGGKKYSTRSAVVEFELPDSSNLANATTIGLVLDFEAAGNAITSITSVELAQN